jgi:cytochrome b561
MAHEMNDGVPVYTKRARVFHWLTALLVAVQIAIGLYMTYRGYEMPWVDEKGENKTGVFDATTGLFYDSHKVLGLLILAIVVWRLSYRLRNGAPPSDPSVPAAMTGIAHATHWSIYLLLILLPIGGYIGVSYFGALDAFGLPLLAVTAKDEKFAEFIFSLHEIGAYILLALVALHVAAALYHRFIRRDKVVTRMLPKRV